MKFNPFKKIDKWIYQKTWRVITSFSLFVLIGLYVTRKCFLFPFVSCLLAIMVYKIIEDAKEKGISIFASFTDDRMWMLSFVYKDARELKKEFMSNAEIHKILKRKFKNKEYGFLQYTPSDKKIKEYTENITFVQTIINDYDLLFNYVVTVEWGEKKFAELVSIYDKEDQQKEAYLSLQALLADESKENVEVWQYILPELCMKPFIQDPLCPERKIEPAENLAFMFSYFPKENIFKALSYEKFSMCINKIAEANPFMEIARRSAINKAYSHHINNMAVDEKRLAAYKEKIDSLKKSYRDNSSWVK